MNKPHLHFAHANGFPAPVYRKLIDRLGERYDVGYIDAVGHDSRYPVTDCWPNLVDETVHFIEARYPEPVIGVGHSLGGLLVLFAALKRPELFKSLVILDSPLFGPWRARGLLMAKTFGMIDKVTPAAQTRRRRAEWPSVEAARHYFSTRRLFAELDPQCLDDYAEFGTVEQDGVRKLRFEPEIEYRIFRGLPHNYHRYRGLLQVPAAYIVGSRTHVVGESDLAFMRRHFGMSVLTEEGTHLYPLERPLETAERIHAALAGLGQR
ncbi:alpha/beta fold hydrolase [Crenobacter cavernae]|uniref:Alpha/beta hydrolase n=1 Tax=Crenobacter cavernae TaxID=2290923 RepID=A0ABY0FA82_9NEIS|nr:alpha/beta hydrolase [Crenobacter cavernae]RXZ42559.1 alpha/beta hydrolase [Crenobacter cavernae]